ncbi:nitrous oxide reductase accessory protein NosL [Spirosoma gilvum]
MKTYSRVAVLLAALSLIGTYFLPLWRIDLWAPQYPEGLVMKIWLSKLSGDVEVINGLNHYIGMAHIKAEMFPEFGYMPYLVAFFIAFGVLTALLKSRNMLLANFGMFVLAGVAALYDFWQWGYEYGHNLDPKAPIQVPGMAYQPPLLGYKALLNFGAYSIPDLGGWIFIVAGILVAIATASEWLFSKQPSTTNPKRKVGGSPITVALLLFGVLMQGCSIEPDPIRYGQDACHHCKMTIVDQKFAAEFVTAKGKAYKFDDVACLAHYLAENKLADNELALVLVNAYAKPGTLIDARTAVFVQSDAIHSPMIGNTAAFTPTDDRSEWNKATARNWQQILSHLHE